MIKLILFAYSTCAFLAILLHLPKIFGFRYGFKKAARYSAKEKRRIAVVIPARNESSIIGDLFASLKSQDYDRDCFEAFVIVKENTDPTIKLSQNNGFRVTVIEDQRCKGDALDGFFKLLPEKQFELFDAFVIVDADGVLSPSYLSELNNALECDADIFVTRKLTKNFLGGREMRSLYSNCAALTWPMIDDLGNSYRTEKEMPLNICGQGLMVRRKVIKELGGWPYRSITEDYELKLDSILRGFKSAYYPYAVLYTEEALGHRENYIRRVRWMAGYRQNDVNYKHRIEARAKSRKRLTRGEIEYFFGVVPYFLFIVTTILTILFGIVTAFYYALNNDQMWVDALLLLVAIPISVLYVILYLYTLIALTVSRDTFSAISVGERIAVAFYNPFYILEYLNAYLSGIFQLRRNKNIEWKQTERITKDNETK